MDFLIAFLIFTGTMIASIIWNFSMLIPLLVGYFAFSIVAIKRGSRVSQIGKYTFDGVKKSMVVVKIMVCIGVLTAMWRAGGTILFFVYYGVKIITPHIFILMAFLLCALLSYALGTSFGVSGTMGVILMSIAVVGGANPVITGGAIISGVYFGDRCSYASSSAVLTAMLTDTDMQDNVPLMLKTGWLPITITTVIYAVISYFNPMMSSGDEIVTLIEQNYSVAWMTAIPAIIMFVLPLLKVPVWITMLISAAGAYLSAVFLQGKGAVDMLIAMIMGNTSDGSTLGDMLVGGGIVSMLEICGIILLSCSYSEIFEGADMLASVTGKMSSLMNRFGRYVTTGVVGALSCCVFCNQTIADIVTVNITKQAHKEVGGTDPEFAMDLENSLIVIAGLVPWCLACKVPLSLIGADASSLPFAFMLYLIPIVYFFTKKIYFGRGEVVGKI